MLWQLLNSGSALAAAFVIGSLIGAGAIVWATIRALELVWQMMVR